MSHPLGRLFIPSGSSGAAHADRDRSTVAFAAWPNVHPRPVRVPKGDREHGCSPLVGHLRGAVLREHPRDLMVVHQPQIPALEGLSIIIRENGKRSIVASLRAHGTGKNLTAFSRMLFVNPPADGAAWEQAIGRCHRQGQLADEVEVELYQHTDELLEAFRKARDFARSIEQTEGTPQKLCLASYVWAAI